MGKKKARHSKFSILNVNKMSGVAVLHVYASSPLDAGNLRSLNLHVAPKTL